MTPRTASFLYLPPEVRLGIYRYLFLTESNKIISPLYSSAYHDLQPAILRTCKLIEEEARTVLYRENTFIHIIHDIPRFDMEASKYELVKRPKEGQRHLDVYLDFSESINAMTLPANRQDKLLLPFKMLFWAPSITIKGAGNRDLATEVQDVPLKFSSMSAVELMDSTLLSVMRLLVEESIMRSRLNDNAAMFATMT